MVSAALGSWKGKEEKLAILKDVHAGSAAVLQGGLMLLAGFAAWLSLLESGNMPERLPQLLPIFLMSRALSALSIYLLPNARGAGTVYDFTAARARRMGRLICGFYLFVAAAALFGAGTLFTGACILAAVLLAALYSGARAALSFGGMTGDLAGFLLTNCETAGLIAAALAFRI